MLRKDVGLRIRVDRDLRNAFVEACKTHDVPASEVLREFMRSFSDTNLRGNQLPLPLQEKESHLT